MVMLPSVSAPTFAHTTRVQQRLDRNYFIKDPINIIFQCLLILYRCFPTVSYPVHTPPHRFKRGKCFPYPSRAKAPRKNAKPKMLLSIHPYAKQQNVQTHRLHVSPKIGNTNAQRKMSEHTTARPPGRLLSTMLWTLEMMPRKCCWICHRATTQSARPLQLRPRRHRHCRPLRRIGRSSAGWVHNGCMYVHVCVC